MKYAWIAGGAAIGGVARYALSTTLPLPFPWQTFVVNLIGGAMIGYFSHRLTGDSRFFWITGICGGFTTFSTFSIEVVTLLEQGRFGMAGAYVVASSVLCVAAAAATYYWTR